jgi:hypothetical protein
MFIGYHYVCLQFIYEKVKKFLKAENSLYLTKKYKCPRKFISLISYL